MTNKRSRSAKAAPASTQQPPADADLEAVIQHYQHVNNEIERHTQRVFDSVHTALHPSADPAASTSPASKAPSGRAASAGPSSVDPIVVELDRRLRQAIEDNQLLGKKHQLLEEAKQKQQLELADACENVERLKTRLASQIKQNEVLKKEAAATREKLKFEELSKKQLNKELESASKQLATLASDKEKLEEKLERCRLDNDAIKKNKVLDSANGRFPVMMKCIRKQATLIDNLFEQISILEHGSDQ